MEERGYSLNPNFFTPEELVVGQDFLRDGYKVFPVNDGKALESMRNELVRFSAQFLGQSDPENHDNFLNSHSLFSSLPYSKQSASFEDKGTATSEATIGSVGSEHTKPKIHIRLNKIIHITPHKTRTPHGRRPHSEQDLEPGIAELGCNDQEPSTLVPTFPATVVPLKPIAFRERGNKRESNQTRAKQMAI